MDEGLKQPIHVERETIRITVKDKAESQEASIMHHRNRHQGRKSFSITHLFVHLTDEDGFPVLLHPFADKFHIPFPRWKTEQIRAFLRDHNSSVFKQDKADIFCLEGFLHLLP